MKRIFRFLALLCVLFSCCAAFAARPRLFLVHVTVVDGTGQPPVLDQTVVISGDHIVAMGPARSLKPGRADRVIDLSGKFLIPGLWDMHVHLAGLNADPAWTKDTLLPLILASGITGVRDMGGDLNALVAWRRGIEQGQLFGPHIVAAGPWLASGGRKTAEQWPVKDAEEARAAVRELHDRGADFIKIISLPSKEVFLAVADESKKQKIPFAGHLPFVVTLGEASDAGMRSIEHLMYSAFSLSYSSKEAELRGRLAAAEESGDRAAADAVLGEAAATRSAEKARSVWDTLKRNGTWVTPTLASLAITAHPEEWKENDPGLDFIPPDLAAKWRESRTDERLKERAQLLARQSANDWKMTAELHHAGVSMLVGSDSLDPFVFPGDSLHRELAELVRAGLTPLEAITAATRGAAEFLGRAQEFGTVAQGKIADLVLLEANPAEDIHNTRRIFAVIRGGQYLDRAALDAMLQNARTAAQVPPDSQEKPEN